jgi:hypothetical protein
VPKHLLYPYNTLKETAGWTKVLDIQDSARISPEPNESLTTHFSDLLVITNEPHISLSGAWGRNNQKLNLMHYFDERIIQLCFNLLHIVKSINLFSEFDHLK